VRTKLALFTALSLGVVLVPTVAAGTTEPQAAPPFEVPQERWAALDEAGLGWMFAGDGYPAQPEGVPWPTEEWEAGELPDGFDAAAIDEFLTWALDPPEGESCCIDAVVAVQGGELVIERYSEAWDPEQVHPSFSMAKSITQAMVGILVAERRLDVFAPAEVPEWSDPSDPRHAITLDHLLMMRSGLEWQEEYVGSSDVAEMLAGEGRGDRAHYAADQPLVAEPGTQFYYSSGTTQIVSRIIADQVGYGVDGTDWARAALFDKLGIGEVVHDLDGTGIMSGSTTFDMTARDFARFGLLYLRGGEWDGEQIVEERWVDYARLPSPDAPQYGAHWWLVGTEDRDPDAFQANGFNGQSITVVPSLDLVVVVLANEGGARPDLVGARVVQAFGDAAAQS
jgi:CubicO group peptidase (beta-lactamase class C family)